MYDRGAIARETRRIAGIYAPKVGWRQARKWGLDSARRFAADLEARIASDAQLSPAARAARDEAIAIHCSTDGPLSTSDRERLNSIRITV